MPSGKIISKWRNALSVVESNGNYAIYRFSKSDNQWKKIIFFKSGDDLHDFIGWLDETFPEDEDEDSDTDASLDDFEDDDEN